MNKHLPGAPSPLLLLAGAALCLWAPGTAHAGASLRIWPIDPVIEADRSSGALWLENPGDAPALIQVRLFGWTQAQGEDVYDGQPAVVASPPVVSIPPKARQLVRLSNMLGVRPAGESAFRIVIDEIPVDPTSPGAADARSPATPPREAHAIKFQMRYSIPLFVYGGQPRRNGGGGAPASAAGATLRCALVERAGRTFVQIRNSGPSHARLVDVHFAPPGRAAPLAEGLLGYVLAGSSMAWPLPAGVTGREPLSLSGPTRGARIVLPECTDG
ncbi:molecular chaperone [Sphingobium aquiterrae]|uniref:fimbrial biogenesis chaperone n=1 Tax=Sphingobium aquiterrae TaxID=2038656 RepID=UPI00301A06A5